MSWWINPVVGLIRARLWQDVGCGRMKEKMVNRGCSRMKLGFSRMKLGCSRKNEVQVWLDETQGVAG